MKISGDGISEGSSTTRPHTVAYFGLSNSCIAQMEANLEICTEVSNSENHSDVDEFDLGDFLMETFEGMEAQGNLLSHVDVPV